MNIHWRRVWGVVLRHLYSFIHTGDRIVDAFYWPSLDIIIWGLTFAALERQSQINHNYVASILLAIILWYGLWRGQYEITVSILDEFWSDNLGNLLSAPLSILEWVLGMCILGIIKLFMTVVFTALVAYALYSVNIFSLGIYVLPLMFSLLLMGWAFGLMVGSLFLRWGTGIQTLAWAGAFALMPFSATYYALETLPKWVQAIGQFLPSSYVFEGMRMVLVTGSVPIEMLVKSYILDLVYLILGAIIFYKAFVKAKENGIGGLK